MPIAKFGISRLYFLAIVLSFLPACGKKKSGTSPQQKNGSTGSSLTCTVKNVDANGHETCGCNAIMPVNLSDLTGAYGIWPFGVHGGGHPEGHPGIDFNSGPDDPAPKVVAVASGVVESIEPDVETSGSDVSLRLNCGALAQYYPVCIDATKVKVGTTFAKGATIGIFCTETKFPPQHYFMHYGMVFQLDQPTDNVTACPGAFFSSADNQAIQKVLDTIDYTEREAHTLKATCNDRTSASFEIPAEAQVCNAHYSEANTTERQRFIDCIDKPNQHVW